LYAVTVSRAPSAAERQIAVSALEALKTEWLAQCPELAIETAAETWVRESEPDVEYDKDLIYVHSRKGTDKARRSSLVEFDMGKFANLKVTAARLELSPTQAGVRVRQSAALIPSGIEHATWNKYQERQASSFDPFEEFGVFNITTQGTDVGKYLASNAASREDLQKLQTQIDSKGKITLVLSALENRERFQMEWDDGEGPGTNGRKPRLVLQLESFDADKGPPPIVIQQARMSALTNLCHAMINSPEFVYVD
jgi:hypothetical protein